MTGETETRADRRGHARLRKVAGEWFPTIAVELLDRIVAAAWIEGRSASGGSLGQTAIVAAAAVRRDGLRALRGEEVDLPPDAQERIAALTADDPGAVRGQHFRRRARREAHGRRALETPADDEPRAAATATAITELRAKRLARATAPASGLPAPATISPVPASPTAAPTDASAAARPVTSHHRTNARRLRRALAFVALIAVAVVVVALVSSIAGANRDATRVALVRAPGGASDIAAVLQTAAAKAQALQKAAERRAAHRRAAALAAKRTAKRRAAHRRAAKRHAAKRRAAAARSKPAKPRAVQRRLPPARSVPPPAAPRPQPTHHAPSPSGGGSWGGEFGP